MIPLGANIENGNDVEFESVDAGRVMAGMEKAGNNLNMVILDACRNNPYARSFRASSRGLAAMDVAKGSLVLYATSPGDVASDGTGRNGLFTQHLMTAIQKPNLTVETVFKQTAKKVYQATGGKQTPWQSGVIIDNFYFTINAPKASTVSITPPATQSNQAEILFWESIKNESSPEFFNTYLKKYPQGIYAELAKLKIQRDGKVVVVKPSETETQQTGRLTIKTSPDNAKIRILNIGPKYQQGIQLKPGRYHIEVSQKGYKRHTEWVELKNEDTIHSVVLEEKQQQATNFAQPTTSTARPSTDTYSEIEMVSIPAGCFQMGGNKHDDEKPIHRVCLSAYKIGKYEVTQSQWQKVMGNNPSYFKGSNKPVEQVSWDDAQSFIRKLNQQTGQHYRLPTEAEWEYACRSGGRNQEYCGGNNANSVGWYYDNSGSTTHNVGRKQANGLRLYDMSGNVWEWVQDWYGGNYYSNSPTNNPKGPSGGSVRVFRGGSWGFSASVLRSAYRGNDSPDSSNYGLGFRLARTR